jgi:hypothetical protein
MVRISRKMWGRGTLISEQESHGPVMAAAAARAARLLRTEEEKEFLRQVNDSLIKNQKQLQLKLTALTEEAKVTELKHKEQVQVCPLDHF